MDLTHTKTYYMNQVIILDIGKKKIPALFHLIHFLLINMKAKKMDKREKMRKKTRMLDTYFYQYFMN